MNSLAYRRLTAAAIVSLVAAVAAASRADDPATAPVPEPAVAGDRSGPPATVSVPATTALPTSGVSPAAVTAGSLWRSLGLRPFDAALPSILMFGVMSIAPAVFLMTTCFVRMSVVLALVRHGIGAPQIPSNQIVGSLAIFLSGLVMWPVWTEAWRAGVEPYQQGTLTAPEAFDRGSLPLRRWMATQIERSGNRDTMLLFLARHPAGPRQVRTYDDVPIEALLPAFLVSELETAFSIGLRLLLPFLVLDILVATLVVSTGLVMLPPSLVSLPLKLLVFVAADGWTLVIRALLDGFGAVPPDRAARCGGRRRRPVHTDTPTPGPPIMETELAELVRQAVVTGLVVAAPVLVVGLIVGTLTGLVQAATGVHETILGFVPRIVATAATLLFTLPWMVERLVEFLRQSAVGS